MQRRFSGIATRVMLLCGMFGMLSGCSSFWGGESSRPSGAVATPGYKVGAPYEIGGKKYFPSENYSYDETGIASWYGPGFHRGKTANGEIFDANELTAAHPTLPMPTLARVTNLDNGRSVVVRINDRGPFAHSRLIDVSRKAADLLGFLGKGTAKVRVQVLADESRALAAAASKYHTYQAGQDTPATTFATAAVTPVRTAPVQTPYAPPKAPSPQLIAHNIGETGMELPQVAQLPAQPNLQIYVQAGSFTIRQNAEALQAQVAKFGSTSIAQNPINGIMFYRVRIGPIPDVAKADLVLAKVASAGVVSPRIIVD